jgi:hypothetical protein
MLVHFYFRSWIETLDAWSLDTYALLLVSYVYSCHALRTWYKSGDVGIIGLHNWFLMW